jgi:hypothetical protein
MPTAISASDIIKFGGGHIDILARTTGRKITVIELKDENVDKEPIEKVLTQATAYSIFLLNLLRSDYGKQWYGSAYCQAMEQVCCRMESR